jgi:ABC-2 type transport system ATP-binding protein
MFGLLPSRNSVLAVDRLSFAIQDGEVFGLLGVNGAGKTTLSKLLCTLLEPTSGTAVVGGHDIRRNAARIRPHVNMVAGGERMLYSRLTGRENLEYFAALYAVPRRECAVRIQELLEIVGMTEHANRRVEEYSKGMKQRLQIARGLVNKPTHLFLDEPTLGLDAPIARDIRRLVKERLEMTVVFTSHYMSEMEELCDRVAVLDGGRLLDIGTPAELRRQYRKSNVVTVTLESLPDSLASWFSNLAKTAGGSLDIGQLNEGGVVLRMDTVDNVTGHVVEMLSRKRLKILELREEEPSLEDVMVSITEARRA